MYDYKQNVAAFVPVRVFNPSGAPVTGINFTAVTATVQKSDGTTQTVTVTVSDWLEIASGAFTGTGVYLLKLPAGALNIVGFITYAVATPGNTTHIGTVKVVSAEASDIPPILGTPIYGSIALDIGNVKSDIAGQNATLTTINNNVVTVNNNVTVLRKYEEGRWKVHIGGPDANRLVLYDTDGVTPILKFDLKDSAGSSTFVNPFERIKVP